MPDPVNFAIAPPQAWISSGVQRLAADWQDGGFGCQSVLIRDSEHLPDVLFRLLFGTESLGLARGGAFGQKLNSVVSHVTIVSRRGAQCSSFGAIVGRPCVLPLS